MSTAPVLNKWVMCPKANPQARLRLFCFPYAGGNALAFRAWPDGLPAEIELYALQPPGRGRRLNEVPFSHVQPYVEAVAVALRPYLDKPFAFFGHSLGALVAFELARQLRRQGGGRPFHLFVAGRRAPHLPDPDSPIHQLPEAEFVAALRGYQGTPEEVLQHQELLQLLLPTLRADFAVNETYVYTAEGPLDCPITALGGVADAEASVEELEAWGELTAATFSLHLFPGNHFFIHSARPFLLRCLATEVAATVAKSTCVD